MSCTVHFAAWFQVTLLSAQGAGEDGTYSPEYDHLALLADLDQRWLVDVGFGSSRSVSRSNAMLGEPAA